MKLINIKIAGCALASLLFFSQCDDKDLIAENNKWEYLDSSNNANVRIVHCFAGNTPQIPTAPNLTTGPQVFVYANGQKLNGNALSYGGQWPSPNVYATIPSGNVEFKIVNARMNLAAVPNVPAPIAGDTLYTFTQQLDKGKYYSMYMGDTVPFIRFVVKEDVMPVPDYQTYKIRLAHMIMNPTDTLTLYSRRQAAEIISNITHKQVSDWVQLPLPIISDTLEIRKKGSTTTYITVGGTAPSFSPTGLRFYTVVLRGKTGVTGKTVSAAILTNR